MSLRNLQWINTPVVMEAILRYQQKRLPPSLKLWVEELLELKDSRQTETITPFDSSSIN
tara:strand:+ start:701 stop:877 length:177 start_codon:yes stop_codon:yes gene_type:complete